MTREIRIAPLLIWLGQFVLQRKAFSGSLDFTFRTRGGQAATPDLSSRYEFEWGVQADTPIGGSPELTLSQHASHGPRQAL
jgi:hypothetical protein